jgi:alpha-ribazole phosphatase
MRVYLIRHTESIGNQRKVYAGTTDFTLTEKGKVQIQDVLKQLTKMINKASKTNLYSSPLLRCTLLSDEIEALLGVTKKVDDRLSETNFGLFEGKTYAELQTELPKEIEKWNQDFIHYQIPNGESLKQSTIRIDAFCQDIILKNEDVVVVSHGGMIKLILLNLLNLQIDHFWKFFTSNGSIIEIEYNDGFGYLKNIIQLD